MSGAGALRTVVRHGTFPLFAFGPAALAMALVEHGLTPTTLAGAGLVVLASYALLAALERWAPHRPEWNEPQGDVVADVGYFLLIGPGSAAASAALASLLVGAVHEQWPASVNLAVWPSSAPMPLQLLLACFIAEFGHYVVHRLGHELPLVWRLHAVHHSAHRLYWLNATRFHPLDLLAIAFAQVLPLHLLGIPPETYLVYAVASSCYGQLQHCNVDLDSRAYGWLFATPELHRWHHSKVPAEGNSNYGAILIFWDQLLRTRFWPGRPITEAVGLGDPPEFPEGLIDQLRAPFRWSQLGPRDREL